MSIWVSHYVGFPNCIATDHGPRFKSKEKQSRLHTTCISAKSSGVEGINTIGTGERYQSYLRRFYKRIKAGNTVLNPDLMLQLAVKSVNYTAHPSGLIPKLLVLVVLPRIPVFLQKISGQRARMNAIDDDRMEIARISHGALIGIAFRHNVPAVADM